MAVEKAKNMIFLSTRSHEREPVGDHRHQKDGISIHPLSRAGTDTGTVESVEKYFYPPALTSGNESS